LETKTCHISAVPSPYVELDAERVLPPGVERRRERLAGRGGEPSDERSASAPAGDAARSIMADTIFAC